MGPPLAKESSSHVAEKGTVGKKPAAQRVVAEDACDAKRQLFAAPSASAPVSPKAVEALPEEASQATNSTWVKDNGAEGIIKITGKGRTVAVVRKEMECFKLGKDAARDLVIEHASLFKQPEESQAAHNAWVQENLGDSDERKVALPLTGKDRTAAVIGADIAIAIAGAKFATSSAEAIEALPEEASQATNIAWVKGNGAQGIIKLTGKGRTVEAVRREMECFKLGADAIAHRVHDGDSALLKQPEESQAAHNAWVGKFLKDNEERKKTLPLTGEGRDASAVAADVKLVIAGAKQVLTENKLLEAE